MRFIKTMSVLGVLVCLAVKADDARFIALYDAEKYEEAARVLQSVSLKNPEVLCRVGAMYYSGLGVEADRERGKGYLEEAMNKGNAHAGVNLVKIYYKIERNMPKAAWCLLKAESCADASVKEDILILRGHLGEYRTTGVVSYIEQLHEALKTTRETARVDLAKAREESSSLHGRMEESLNENKRMISELEKKLSDEKELRKKEKKQYDDESSEHMNKIATLEKKLSDEKDLRIKEKKQYDDENLAHTNKIAALEKEVVGLKASLDKKNEEYSLGRLVAENEAADARRQANDYKRIIQDMKTTPASANLDRVKMTTQEIVDTYNEFAIKHNDLVERYNKLLKILAEQKKSEPKN